MTTTIELLNALKAKTGAVSDYSLAKKLDITRATVSVYTRGRGSFSDETALKAASILEINPEIVLASIHAERAKSEAERSVWLSIFRKFGGEKAMDNLPKLKTQEQANTPSPAAHGIARDVYYVKL